MISPSPTRMPPETPASEEKKRTPRPIKKRAGETAPALFIKSILRPIFKGLYYLIRLIRRNILLSVLVLLLLIGSVSATYRLVAGQWPFGIGSDPFNFNVQGQNDQNGIAIKNWLYALRDADTPTLQVQSANISPTPDLATYIKNFSQTDQRYWKTIRYDRGFTQDNGLVDSFVTVEYSSNGPGGKTDVLVVWHFITISANGKEYVLGAEPISVR